MQAIRALRKQYEFYMWMLTQPITPAQRVKYRQKCNDLAMFFVEHKIRVKGTP